MDQHTGPQSGSQPTAIRFGVSTTPGRRRRDAERNRTRVLDAAAALVAERGLDAVSMDDVARAAGVGKGTVFRAVGDRSGLAAALIDQRERELQEAILTGPSPLGVGAPPIERLRAFVDAYIELLESTVDILLVAENATTGARYRTGAYDFWIAHVRSLIARLPSQPDADATAHAVMAPLAADLFAHLRREAGYTRQRYRAVATVAVEALDD